MSIQNSWNEEIVKSRKLLRKNSSSQNGNCGGVIFQPLIEAADDEVLNLDDNSQYDCFLTETISTLDEIQKECPGNMPIFEEEVI